MIEIVNITNIPHSEINQVLTDVLHLYISAFPECERREWNCCDDIISFMNLKTDKFRILIITLDNNFAGFMSYWDFNTHIYIEHLAIKQHLRSKSLGSTFINYAIDNICNNILIEVEHPDTEEALRRISFYNRHKFRLWKEIEYIQPPYSPRLSPTPLLLMTHGKIDLLTGDDIVSQLKSEVYQSNR